jgi:hypothetical protein
MMAALNTLRNKIAHRSRHKVLKLDISELVQLVEGKSDKLREAIQGTSQSNVVVHAAALCGGLLSILTDHLLQAQGSEVEEDE